MANNIQLLKIASYSHRAFGIFLAILFWWIPVGLHRLWMRRPYWWLHTLFFCLSAVTSSYWFAINSATALHVYADTGRILPHMGQLSHHWLLLPSLAWTALVCADWIMVWIWPSPIKTKGERRDESA